MALITGLPNFYSAAGPVATDFNDAAKAIVSQLGGSYYDEAQGAYTVGPGNLSTANIATSPELKNSQKAEPFSVAATTVFVRSTGTYVHVPAAGPFAYDTNVYGIGIEGISAGFYLASGSVGVLINDQPFMLLYVDQASLATISAANMADSVWWRTSINLRIGDSITIEPEPQVYAAWSDATEALFSTAARVQGSPPATFADVSFSVVFLTRTMHVRA